MLFDFLCEQIAELHLPVTFRMGDNAECISPNFRFRRHKVFYNSEVLNVGFVYGRTADSNKEVLGYNYIAFADDIRYITHFSTLHVKTRHDFYLYGSDKKHNAFLRLIEVALTPVTLFVDEPLVFHFVERNGIFVLKFDELPIEVPIVTAASGDVLIDRDAWKELYGSLRAGGATLHLGD